MKRLFDFYLDASIHVSLAVVSLSMVTALFFDIPLKGHLGYFIFFGTIVNYNFIKYGVEAKKYLLVGSRYHKNIQFFSFVCFLLTCYHGWFLGMASWGVILILTGLTGLYALPVLPNARNLRSLGGLKVFMVAMVWAGITVVLPLVEMQKVLVWDVWVEVVQRILLVLALLIPFEIRDLTYDAPDLNTIPQRFGVFRAKIFGIFIVILFLGLTYAKDFVTDLELISKGMLSLVLGGLILATKRNQSKYYSSFWVEAVPMLWGGLIWAMVYWF